MELLTAILLFVMCSLAYCYDPMDPDGNITVTFDILKWTDDGYMARVTIQNYYLYRHIGDPGWQLGWTWAKDEVIWSMTGAYATQQGNCSAFKSQIPYSCQRNPIVGDLSFDASGENRSKDCCHSGILLANGIDPDNSFTSFEMLVGNLNANTTGYLPKNLTLMAPGPGYTCGPFADYKATIYGDGKREWQAFRTMKSVCSYSPFVSRKAPMCCVSLTTFYSPTITSCPVCSCACRVGAKDAVRCIGSDLLGDLSDNKTLKCTDHMCPIRVHWHLKNNYQEHWRVKLTISNYNYGANYSNWNLLVQHPGLSQSPATYSFNSTMLPTVGFEDEVVLFWGKENYNQELLQATEQELGSATTEILMGKDPRSFTFRNGWAFPRRIYFNGENCEMPLPDDFPMLPNGSSRLHSHHHLFLLLILLYLTSKTLVAWSR